jgi:hypothetical protein
MLGDLMTGCACIKLVDQVNTLTDTTFADADEIYTTEGSLAIAQAEASKTESKIDQSGAAIDVQYTPGEFTVSGTIPSSAIALFDYFFEKSATQPTLTTGIPASDGATKLKQGAGYLSDGRRKRVTMLVESQSHDSAIVFMNVDLSSVINWGTVKTTPLGLNFKGTVMENPAAGGPAFVVLKAA